MIIKPAMELHRSSDGVSLFPGVAGRVTDIMVYRVPKGLGIFIPESFALTLKLSAVIEPEAQLFWGYRVPADPHRTKGFGNPFLYGIFRDLTLSQQRHNDFLDAVTVELGLWPGLALLEDESLVLSLLSPGQNALAADTQFSIPYYEAAPTDLILEVEERQALFGA